MKADLDRLIRARSLDAILIWIDEIYSPPLDYLTGGAHITRGVLVKRPGADAILYVSSMETEEAARSGLETHIYNTPELQALLQKHEGNASRAAAAWWGEILARCGVPSGTIGLYGAGSFSFILSRAAELTALCPGYTFVGEPDNNHPLFTEVMMTKDADELMRLRSVAARTDQVLEATWAFISGHQVRDGQVVNDEGEPLTIGAVKRFVRKTLLDYDLEDTGMIFAQGRDAGFPHSRGESAEVLRPGESIVFDLFPRELGGGYYHDVTRTWSIGYAPAALQALYAQVMQANDIGVEMSRAGMPAKAGQLAVLDYFEAGGHRTLRTHPGTQEGYVHSLGHGIGLNIHEAPSLSHLSSDTLAPGHVITIEPGLYYPEQKMGCRIEDSWYIDADGGLTALTSFHKDLVIPIAGL
jgi:Xaa-Pro aminopeptidase